MESHHLHFSGDERSGLYTPHDSGKRPQSTHVPQQTWGRDTLPSHNAEDLLTTASLWSNRCPRAEAFPAGGSCGSVRDGLGLRNDYGKWKYKRAAKGLIAGTILLRLDCQVMHLDVSLHLSHCSLICITVHLFYRGESLQGTVPSQLSIMPMSALAKRETQRHLIVISMGKSYRTVEAQKHAYHSIFFGVVPQQ